MSSLLSSRGEFSVAPNVRQIVRLALTPKLDGSIEPEEWDLLSTNDNGETYFQWEPETLYWGAKVPDSSDAVLTLDMGSNGWLVGNDNLEFRVNFNHGEPIVNIRRLDATDPNGPKWVPANVLMESIKVSAKKADQGWILESSFIPQATMAPAPGQKLGVRCDLVPTGSDLGEPSVPRVLSFVSLQYDLGQNLPTGFSWKPDFLVRNVPVDDDFTVKYGFRRTEEIGFDHIEFRPEGSAQGTMASGQRPFPDWDKKGRTREDYKTSIAKDAGTGFRILRVSLHKEGQPETVLRSSFKISELVDFNVNLPKSLELHPDARIIRGSIDIRSNGLKSIKGVFNLSVPEEWTVTRNKQTNFTIYHSRGLAKIPVEFIIPKDTVGVFPLKYQAVIGDKTIAKTMFLPVGQQ